MSDKFYLTDEFKELHAKWMDKLKESGFEEIESGPYLRLWHSTYFFNKYSVEEIEESEAYYRLCSDFYWRYKFADDTQKKIWALHSEGHSRRKITQMLKNQGIQVAESAVQIIVSSLKKIMQSNNWPLSEKGPHARSDREIQLPLFPWLHARR